MYKDIEIYYPENGMCTITVEINPYDDEIDQITDITESVIYWCSNNGYSYDDCTWEYSL